MRKKCQALFGGGSKITADGDCSHENKRCLPLGRKAMTNLDSILKTRDITLSTNMFSQGYGFYSGHVWMWELDYKESWALKNRCLWTVMLEKTLESPLDCKEIQPVHPKGDKSWCSLEGLMFKLKFQHFGYLMQRADSLEKTLMLGKTEGRRKRGWQDNMVGWHYWLNDMGLGGLWRWWWTGRPGVLQFMGSQRVGDNWATELNWNKDNHFGKCIIL